MKVAAIQMVSTASLTQNLDTALTLLNTAAIQGAKLVVLPEYFCAISHNDQDKLQYAEYAGDLTNSPIQKTIAQAAKDLNIWIAAGTIPLRSEDSSQHVRNGCLVYNNQGELVVRYDKIHLFHYTSSTEHYDESVIHEAGTMPKTFEMPLHANTNSSAHSFFKIGLSICYDLRFPELYRQLSAPNSRPCDIMLVPSAFTHHTGQAHWEILLRARAIENQCYIIAAAQGGTHENGRRSWGHSMIIDPWGQILSMQATGEGIVYAHIEQQRLQTIRNDLPALQNRVLID